MTTVGSTRRHRLSIWGSIAALLVTIGACRSESGGDSHDESLKLGLPAEDYCVGSSTTSICDWVAPREVLVLDDASALILDRQSDLSLLRRGDTTVRVGRTGDGPGEFRFIADVAMSDSGDILAFDVRHFRIEQFKRSGKFVRSIAVIPDASLSDLRMSKSALIFLRIDGADSINADVSARVSWLSVANGMPSREYTVKANAQTRKGTDLRPLPRPFAPAVIWDADASGNIAIGFGADPTVRMYDSTSRQMGTIVMNWRPQSISRAEHDSVADALRNPGGRPSPSSAYNAQAEAAIEQMPRLHPLADKLLLGADGMIWIRHAGSVRDSTVWTRFTPDGRRSAELRIASGTRLMGAVKDSVDLLNFDETGRGHLIRRGVGVQSGAYD